MPGARKAKMPKAPSQSWRWSEQVCYAGGGAAAAGRRGRGTAPPAGQGQTPGKEWDRAAPSPMGKERKSISDKGNNQSKSADYSGTL